MTDVIKTIASLDAQATLVGRSVSAGHILDAIVFYVIREQATDPAVRADRIYLLIDFLKNHLIGRHECASGTGLNALTTAHT